VYFIKLFLSFSTSAGRGGEGRNALTLIYPLLWKNGQTDKFYIRNDIAARTTVKVRSYYVYFGLPHRGEDPWECTATSVGYERVRPGSPYPPRRHPVDHHFNWDQGRVLLAYQLVYITEGKGTFESEVSPERHDINAGMVVTLFPGVWHRYAPDPQTGWVEQWIECRGPAFDRAREVGLLRPERPVWHVGFPSELLQGFERCHALAQQRSAGVQSLLSTMGLHLLSLLPRAARKHRRAPRHIDQIVQQAQSLLAHRYHERFTVEQLARDLNVSYSSFRQAFKAQTGISPKQYQLQIRLDKAQDFLANTPKSVGEIAEILGFDSPFHLSKQFRDSIGLAPQIWRKKLARRAAAESGNG
jgi:AraC-like DNA-binding protein